jgi:hypothetical protein
MSDHTRWIVQRQDNASSDFHIRLNFCHPGLSQATRLLATCGECEIVEAAGIVYRFVSVVARDNALHRLRFKLGWTVASAFDGRPWSRGEPASRYLQSSSQ